MDEDQKVAWVLIEGGVVVARIFLQPGEIPTDNKGNTWTKET